MEPLGLEQMEQTSVSQLQYKLQMAYQITFLWLFQVNVLLNTVDKIFLLISVAMNFCVITR